MERRGSFVAKRNKTKKWTTAVVSELWRRFRLLPMLYPPGRNCREDNYGNTIDSKVTPVAFLTGCTGVHWRRYLSFFKANYVACSYDTATEVYVCLVFLES